MQLRDYQLNAANKIQVRLAAGCHRQLAKQATGMGKTALFCALPNHLGFTKRTMVLDHRNELTNQAVNKLQLWNDGHSVGVEMGDRRSNGERFVVAGVQTIGRKGSPRLTQFDPFDFDMLVVDEAHHATADSYQTVIEHFTQNPKLLLFGLTATVNRADGEGLGKTFHEIVDDLDILYGINKGWLAELRGIRIKTDVSLDEVHMLAGEFNEKELGHAVDTPARNLLVVVSWLQHAKGRSTVVFAANVYHSQNLADKFVEQGVVAEAIWGGDPDREGKLARHRAGTTTVLVNCELLIEGYDDWRIGCVALARPCGSEGLYTQIIGRGTRIPDNIPNLKVAQRDGLRIDKADCIILDFVDATKRHSLVTLASLFGMAADIDLQSKPISAIAAEIAAVKVQNPFLDITCIKDVNKIQIYAEQVDLFKVAYPPEIIQISTFQWHKVRENSYGLVLPNREGLTVLKDLLDVWHIVGTVKGCVIHDKRPTFEEALREADWKVNNLGGRSLGSVAKRDPEWGKAAPSPLQLFMCRLMRIPVPAGATKGEVAAKINVVKQKLQLDRDKARKRGSA